MYIEITILIIAGLLKAVKDRLDDNPYTQSIFPRTGAFWVRGTGKKRLSLHFDMWHIADFLYINCFCLLIALHFPILDYGIALNALIYFLITQLSFNIFYFIFKKR